MGKYKIKNNSTYKKFRITLQTNISYELDGINWDCIYTSLGAISANLSYLTYQILKL